MIKNREMSDIILKQVDYKIVKEEGDKFRNALQRYEIENKQ